MTLAVEKIGRRYYISGNTYPIKSTLKAAGCKWDPDRKSWWTGKKAVAERFEGTPAPNRKFDNDKPNDDTRLYGKVKYTSKSGKTRTYYVIAKSRDDARYKLTVLDGSIVFWADASRCEWIKTYGTREVWDGRYYSNRTVTRHTTLGSIRAFVAKERAEKRAEEPGEPLCAECGRPGHLVADLEDGAPKHRHCCDIAP